MLQTAKNNIIGALRWSERYTRTDMLYLTKGGFWLVASQIVSALAGLALAVAFANMLSKETYGIYRFVLSVAGIFAAATFSGMNTSLTRAIAQGEYSAYVPVYLERIKWGTLGGVASIIASAYYWSQGNDLLAVAFLITAIFIPLSDPLNVFEAYRNGLRHFQYTAFAEMTIRVGGVVGMLIVLYLTQNVLVLVAAYFCIYAALRLLFFMQSAADAHQRSAGERFDVSEILRYGRHLSVIYVIGVLAMNLDKIVLFHYAGAAAVAAYAFALVFLDQIRSFIKNIATLAYPKFVTQPFENVLRGMASKNAVLGSVTLIIAIAYITIAPFVFKLLFPAYVESILLTQVLALTLIDTLTLLPLSALKAHGRTAELYRYNIGIGVVQIALITFGGMFYGLYGVAFAYGISRVFAVTYLWVLMRSMRSHA